MEASGHLASAISNVVIQRIRETTGRGPERARTTIGRDAVFVVVEDTLTRGERVLVEANDAETVELLRAAWQRAMSGPVRQDIEQLTGRPVIAFLGANHIDPDLAVETFILAPNPAVRDSSEEDSQEGARAA
jgi:uncharacterized protein YbcI